MAIPCRADEPGLGDTLVSLYQACLQSASPLPQIAELLICINGVTPGAECSALTATRTFCARNDIPLHERWIADQGRDPEAGPVTDAARVLEAADTLPIPVCTVLLTERRGKPPAWNVLWSQAVGAAVLFCDADVRVDQESVRLLQVRLHDAPHLSLVAAREVPVLTGRGTLWSRMAALPYRFDFGNVGGRLLAIRKDALLGTMPEDLLLEDAWLTVAVGKSRVAKEWQAKVYFLPPATGRDYFAERVRTEGGKLQIRRVYGQLLEHGQIATYRWSDFLKEIAWHEYPLVFFSLVLRAVARAWARLALTKKEFYALYRPFPTTKTWSQDAHD
ncbi:MAG: hypothetical protein HYZ50_06505 [Deltaproteobacteria bacterium]|nr:hypothetical protein [Deltaproteobacteria bacterium]